MLKIKTYPFTSILGWSLSRYDVFKTCKRQYFYQYYGRYDPDIPRGRIDSLKRLTSIPLEIGNITHHTISAVLKRLLKSRSPINRDRFQRFVETATTQACDERTFFEVHYREMERITAENVLPAVETALENFLESPWLNWIKDHALVEGQQWLIEPGGFGEARIDGMKVYCKVDFMFMVDDRTVILDWKTGRPDLEKHTKQMMGYCTWAGENYNANFDRIDAIIAYLRPSYREERLSLANDSFAQFTSQIRRETEEMYNICKNVQENTPLEKPAFPMIPQSIICRYCHFKELCHRV